MTRNKTGLSIDEHKCKCTEQNQSTV